MLTDEERKKIYEEEKARLEAQEDLNRKAKGKGSRWHWWIALGALGVLGYICLSPSGKSRTSPTQSGSSASSSSPASYEPALELGSWNWTRTEGGDYVKVKGQVKNISGERLKNVEAVVTFKDKNGDFITSSDALIDYNPILPGQTSPFSVTETYNPAMRTGNAYVEFKFLMGGTIPIKRNE